MDLSIYFKQVEFYNSEYTPEDLGSQVALYNDGEDFPNPEEHDIVLIGVLEDRLSINNKGCAEAPDAIRAQLYKLKNNWKEAKIADLGNIQPGESVEDTYFAIRQAVAECVKLNALPVILGGSQDLTFANYQAYEELEQVVNIVSIDNRFDLGDVNESISSRSFLNKIILHQPNYLFNYSNLGYQTFFTSLEERQLMDRLYFDVYRLGEVKSDIREVEPVVRNADILSFDLSAIRFSDAPGNKNATPNGFNGEEACAITRYAGLSDKLSSIGFYELNPSVDTMNQTSFLVAEMIWYFMEGFYNRKYDTINRDKKELLKYIVATTTEAHEIIFYKNLRSDRWWMDVPYPESKLSRYRRHQLVPCSYHDYQMACNDEVPQKWWRNYQKLH